MNVRMWMTQDVVTVAPEATIADVRRADLFRVIVPTSLGGHGLGLDVHEESFMVKGNKTPLQVGMCFSIEPMMCIYGEFGVRLEDIAYMAEDGARWFTQPAHTVDDPFAYEA